MATNIPKPVDTTGTTDLTVLQPTKMETSATEPVPVFHLDSTEILSREVIEFHERCEQMVIILFLHQS
jgi:hypothetical protein